MCGRYVLASNPDLEGDQFEFIDQTITFPPRYNCAPTDNLPVYRPNRERTRGELASLRWGLIPSWAKDAKIGVKLINALRIPSPRSLPSVAPLFGGDV